MRGLRQTEKLYLEWLSLAISSDGRACVNVSCSVKVEEDPLKWAKAHTNLSGKSRTVYHMFDFEDELPVHKDAFEGTLLNMKKAKGIGRGFAYENSYSNFTFEFWMVLHKGVCSQLNNRNQYLQYINKYYGERFEDLKEYKREANFRRVLSKISLDDVVDAVGRAGKLEEQARSSGFRKRELHGYEYYLDNPVTRLWLPVSRMLKVSDIIK